MLIGPGGTVYLNAKKTKRVFVDSHIHRGHAIISNGSSKRNLDFHENLTYEGKSENQSM